MKKIKRFLAALLLLGCLSDRAYGALVMEGVNWTFPNPDFGHSTLNVGMIITSANVLYAVCTFYAPAATIGSITSFTFNSVAMTNIGSVVQDQVQAHLYRLMAPDAGTHNISVTISGVWETAVCGGFSFSGADTGTPNGTVVTNSHGTTGPATVTVTSASGEIAIAALSSATTGVTSATGPTEQWKLFGTSGGSVPSGSVGASWANQATATFSWPLSGSVPWAAIGVSIKPATGGGGGGGSASGAQRRRGQ